ncbi:hypothetical protein D9M71_832010 [compost metagenome]
MVAPPEKGPNVCWLPMTVPSSVMTPAVSLETTAESWVKTVMLCASGTEILALDLAMTRFGID